MDGPIDFAVRDELPRIPSEEKATFEHRRGGISSNEDAKKYAKML